MVSQVVPKIDTKPSNQIRFRTSVLRSDLCNFNDAFIVVKGTITVTNPDNNA